MKTAGWPGCERDSGTTLELADAWQRIEHSPNLSTLVCKNNIPEKKMKYKIVSGKTVA
jgi:hypothetical protein